MLWNTDGTRNLTLIYRFHFMEIERFFRDLLAGNSLRV